MILLTAFSSMSQRRVDMRYTRIGARIVVGNHFGSVRIYNCAVSSAFRLTRKGISMRESVAACSYRMH